MKTVDNITASRSGLQLRILSRKFIIDGLVGPDPERYNIPRLSKGIHDNTLDVNKWIGYYYLENTD